MARTRTSVELYPGGCRLVEVEVPAARRGALRRTDVPPDVRVRAFASRLAAPDDSTLRQTLSHLKQERKLSPDVWVTVWGLRAVHQLLRLPPASGEALEALARREARKDIAALSSGAGAVSVSVTPGEEVQVGAHRRREVAMVAVPSADVQERIQPLIDAGFVVRGVVTPAQALATIARADRNARGAAAYVAIIGAATCVAIVRDGLLLFSREMPWGHDQKSEVGGQQSDVESIVAARLASELKRSILFFKQTFRSSVDAVVLCGDMPSLRSLTAPLGEALAVPVETLDSLVGIDAAAVPPPADLFRAEAAALRLAIATGAEPSSPDNLLPRSILESREARRQILRFAAAVLVGLVLTVGWSAAARQSLAAQRSERDALQRELAIAEPDAVRQAERRQALTLAVTRQAALDAFDTQGPRQARMLEAIADATPEGIVLTGIDARADGAHWLVTIRGLARSDDAASAQASVNALVDALGTSPFAGAPIQPPSRRVMTSRGGGVAPAGGPASPGIVGAARALMAPGTTGVEFSMVLRVAK